MPRDAEEWLAARGIRREPLYDGMPTGPVSDQQEPAAGPAPISSRQVVRLAAQAAADSALADGDGAALPDASGRSLDDDVAAAVAFVRRSAAVAPQAEARLRTKLGERGWPPQVVTLALERARRERLVDDLAMATALVEERRRKGHAVARIRRDLRARGFGDATLATVLADAEERDPYAAAYAVARRRADRLTALPAETAYRRVAGLLARRGYPEALARKVARDAVFTARDRERAAGH